MAKKTYLRRKHQFIFSTLVLVILGLIYVYKNYTPSPSKPSNPNQTEYSNSLERTYSNYAIETANAANQLDLPYEYLMALIALETSGFTPSGSRFEKHVYQQLKRVKSGDRKNYENITKKTLKEAGDDAIKNLATSWGPFQLMGYKCVGMEVNVHNLRSDEGVYYGAKWIKEEYGRYLKKKRYEDAFHYHNTGRKKPRVGKPQTHDPNYLKNGMKYIEYFKKHKP